MTEAADPHALRALLGDLDPATFEQLEQTDASLEEIQAAYAAFEADRGGEGHRHLSVRETEVYEILEDTFADLEELAFPVAG